MIKGKDYKKAFKRITDIARRYEKYLARVEIGEVTITDSKAINKLKKDVEKMLKGYKVYVNNDELVVEGKMAKITITNTWTISRASCLEDVIKEIRKEYLDKIRKEKIRCEKKWDVKIIIKNIINADVDNAAVSGIQESDNFPFKPVGQFPFIFDAAGFRHSRSPK